MRAAQSKGFHPHLLTFVAQPWDDPTGQQALKLSGFARTPAVAWLGGDDHAMEIDGPGRSIPLSVVLHRSPADTGMMLVSVPVETISPA